MSLQNTYLTIWKASLLYDLQHGFRHSRSCETQLLSFVQQLAANSDKNIETDLIIMDFAKAFDKVPHQQLLYKWNQESNIKLDLCLFIKSYTNSGSGWRVIRYCSGHFWCPSGNNLALFFFWYK